MAKTTKPAKAAEPEEPLGLDVPEQEAAGAAQPKPDAESNNEVQQEKRGRQGDQFRKQCPNCSTPEKPVLCVVDGGNAFFSRICCPNKCGYRDKIARPNLAARMRRAQQRDQQGFSARPAPDAS